jgi:hypothetical protein
MRDGRAVSLSHQRVEQNPKGQNLGSEVPTSAAVPTGAVHNAMVCLLVCSRVLVTYYTGGNALRAGEQETSSSN